jgi:hypothetical protein
MVHPYPLPSFFLLLFSFTCAWGPLGSPTRLLQLQHVQLVFFTHQQDASRRWTIVVRRRRLAPWHHAPAPTPRQATSPDAPANRSSASDRPKLRVRFFPCVCNGESMLSFPLPLSPLKPTAPLMVLKTAVSSSLSSPSPLPSSLYKSGRAQTSLSRPKLALCCSHSDAGPCCCFPAVTQLLLLPHLAPCSLELVVRRWTVHGRLSFNGAPPVSTCCPSFADSVVPSPNRALEPVRRHPFTQG